MTVARLISLKGTLRVPAPLSSTAGVSFTDSRRTVREGSTMEFVSWFAPAGWPLITSEVERLSVCRS